MPDRSELGFAARPARRSPARACVRGGTALARKRRRPGFAALIRAGLALGIGVGLGLHASHAATAQELIAPGVDGGGASLTGSANAQHAVSLGQASGSAALVDGGGHPRWVGGIGGALAARSVPEPSLGEALPLALVALAARRRRTGSRGADPSRRPLLAREPHP